MTDETRDKVGIQIDEASAYPGMLLANAAGGGNTRRRRGGRHIREAALWDVHGKEVHRWHTDIPSKRRSWAITRLDDEGYLYVVIADTAFLKLDWNSNVVWMVNGRFHHDFNVTNDGGFAVLAERKHVVDLPPGTGDTSSDGVRMLDHGVTFVNKEGDVTGQVWLYESFKDHPVFQSRLLRGIEAKRDRVLVEEGDAERGGGLDVFHANSIIVLPRDVEGLGETGDLLFSFRHMNTLASVSRETGEVLWSWGSEDLIRQHDATLTNDGQIVLFDNRTRSSNSRVLVVDPKTSTITRTIGGEGAQGATRFFSMGRGLAQALPNDNVMVVVSNEGRTFEMTPAGDIVWEFWSPWIRPEARLPFRAVRLQGTVQATMAKIAAGQMEPPRVPNDVAFKVSTADTNFVTDLEGGGSEMQDAQPPETTKKTPSTVQ